MLTAQLRFLVHLNYWAHCKSVDYEVLTTVRTLRQDLQDRLSCPFAVPYFTNNKGQTLWTPFTYIHSLFILFYLYSLDIYLSYCMYVQTVQESASKTKSKYPRWWNSASVHNLWLRCTRTTICVHATKYYFEKFSKYCVFASLKLNVTKSNNPSIALSFFSLLINFTILFFFVNCII